MGISYIIDFCLAEYRALQEERSYQAYVADCLQMISESTAKFAGGKYMAKRYKEMMGWEKKVSEPEKTGAEIIADVTGRLNWLMGGENDVE